MSSPSPTPAADATTQWWRDAVVYQLYVRSFHDLDGDGVGDLHGIADRLDYIASLGVDAIWLNPCYPSPNRDGGYDVADYTDIDAAYGGMPAFEKLLNAAHERDIRVIMDLVPNHCSSEHPWFREALASPPGSPARARFHFRDGRGPEGAEPPNNWRSTFGGPAWTRVAGPAGGVAGASGGAEQWYLHSFDTTQPDFNWDNPEVAEMFDDVLRFWFDRGVDGIRIDVAYAMVKHPDLPDTPGPADNPYSWNQPGVHAIFARWRAIADAYGRDIPLIGEVWLSPEETTDYIRPGRLHQAFYFDLMRQPWRAADFRASIEATVASVPAGGGVPAWTLNNHDVHRSVSRYGLVERFPMYTDDGNAWRTRPRGRVDVDLGIRRARAAVMLLLALPGSIYLYQGEELGLPEVMELPDEARRDPIWERSCHREYGRDGSRIPLPWKASTPAFGFSPTGADSPWLPPPDWFGRFAIDVEEADPTSTLTLYREVLRARRDLFAGETIEWLDTGRDDVLAIRRGNGVAVTVLGADPFDPPAEWGSIVRRSDHADGRVLGSDVTAWLRGTPGPPAMG